MKKPIKAPAKSKATPKVEPKDKKVIATPAKAEEKKIAPAKKAPVIKKTIPVKAPAKKTEPKVKTITTDSEIDKLMDGADKEIVSEVKTVKAPVINHQHHNLTKQAKDYANAIISHLREHWTMKHRGSISKAMIQELFGNSSKDYTYEIREVAPMQAVIVVKIEANNIEVTAPEDGSTITLE